MANNQKKIDNSVSGKRSKQNMSFNWLGTSDFGRLVPFHVEELIGSDKVVTCRPKIEIQMLPLASPTFGKMDIYCHYFYVPTRLLWTDFNDFYSQSGDGASGVPPYWTVQDMCQAYSNIASTARRSIEKHWSSFGLPPFYTISAYNVATGIGADKITTLPFRAYNQIWWDFYRDPELIPDSNRTLYLDTSGGRESTAAATNKYYPKLRQIQDTWLAHLFASNGLSPTGTDYKFGKTTSNDASPGSSRDVYPNNTGTTSQQLRRIEALTRLAERLSLGGKRQIDRLYAQYGIRPEFTKLQMCQYIGGAKASVLVSDITSSANTAGIAGYTDSPSGAVLGQKAGAGYCQFNQLNINFEAHEPGYLIGMLSVQPHIQFVPGISKKWYRNSLYDWYRDELEHVGQVAVAKSEVGVRYNSYAPLYPLVNDKETFAFTQPYYDYKSHPDIVAGDFIHYLGREPEATDVDFDIMYMQSMGLYVPYNSDRLFNMENLTVQHKANKVFYYLGGELWQDVDDHFHINADVECIIDRPMDGYAIPTLETTEDPHAVKQNIGGDTVL